MKKIIGILGAAVDMDDVLVLVGLGLLGYGIWMIYPPAALIAIGLVSCSLGVMGSRMRRRNGKNR